MKVAISSLSAEALRLIEETAGDMIGIARRILDTNAKIKAFPLELAIRESVGGESLIVGIMFELSCSPTDPGVVFLRVFVLHHIKDAATAELKAVLDGTVANYIRGGKIQRCQLIRSEHPDEDGVLWVMRITR